MKIKRVFEFTFNVLKFLVELLKGQEYARYTLADIICGIIYPKYKFSDFGRIFLEDKEFLSWHKQYEPNDNFHTLDRKYTLNELIKLTKSIEGDTVECGVYQGASSYLICKNIVDTTKQHHIFDSFEGLSEPNSKDGSHWKMGDLSASEKIVRHNLSIFNNVHYYKGWIPSRFHEVEKLKFSFVHIDVDLYQPTKDSVDFFYERLSVGGILLFDDYGFNTCPGAKLAIDEIFADKSEPIILLPTGQSFIIKQ